MAIRGGLSALQALIRTAHQFFIIRFLLGLTECGTFPRWDATTPRSWTPKPDILQDLDPKGPVSLALSASQCQHCCPVRGLGRRVVPLVAVLYYGQPIAAAI